jgi:hypothetical protein
LSGSALLHRDRSSAAFTDGEAQEVRYNRYFPPDTQAAMFWLRNRRRKQWRERIEHEHTVSDDLLRELEEAGKKARNAHRR